MTFEHIKLPALDFDLEAETTDAGRYYITPNGDRYRSVTTVLASYSKAGIQEWRERVGDAEADKISGKASRRGTDLHDVCEKYLLNSLTPMKIRGMMPHIKQLFNQLKPHFDKKIGEIYCLEQALYSDKMKVAGRVDCIAFWGGVLSVIDFKTSAKFKDESYILNYFMQCSAYAEMFEELTGIPIDQIVVAIAVEGEEFPQFFVQSKTKYLTELTKYVNA